MTHSLSLMGGESSTLTPRSFPNAWKGNLSTLNVGGGVSNMSILDDSSTIFSLLLTPSLGSCGQEHELSTLVFWFPLLECHSSHLLPLNLNIPLLLAWENEQWSLFVDMAKLFLYQTEVNPHFHHLHPYLHTHCFPFHVQPLVKDASNITTFGTWSSWIVVCTSSISMVVTLISS